MKKRLSLPLAMLFVVAAQQHAVFAYYPWSMAQKPKCQKYNFNARIETEIKAKLSIYYPAENLSAQGKFIVSDIKKNILEYVNKRLGEQCYESHEIALQVAHVAADEKIAEYNVNMIEQIANGR